MIDGKNCCVVSLSLPDDATCMMRVKNLSREMKRLGFPLHVIKSTRWKHDKDAQKEGLYRSITVMLELLKSMDCEYGIICQDDFYPIFDFTDELNKTVELLPSDWECLHLCPGFFWGRLFRDRSKIGHFNPEKSFNTDTIRHHESGRFFLDCHGKVYSDHEIWLGGPVAFLIKKVSVDDILRKYTSHYDYDDRVLTRILDNRSFVCREPQLGYEEECRGSVRES